MLFGDLKNLFLFLVKQLSYWRWSVETHFLFICVEMSKDTMQASFRLAWKVKREKRNEILSSNVIRGLLYVFRNSIEKNRKDCRKISARKLYCWYLSRVSIELDERLFGWNNTKKILLIIIIWRSVLKYWNVQKNNSLLRLKIKGKYKYQKTEKNWNGF